MLPFDPQETKGCQMFSGESKGNIEKKGVRLKSLKLIPQYSVSGKCLMLCSLRVKTQTQKRRSLQVNWGIAYTTNEILHINLWFKEIWIDFRTTKNK